MKTRSITQRFAAAAALPALAVGASCDTPKPDDPYVPAAIDTVAISPAAGVVTAGDEIELRVDAWDVDGNYIWLEDRPEVAITWTAELEREPGDTSPIVTAPVNLAPSDSNPVTLTVLSTLPGPVALTASVSAGTHHYTAVATLEPGLTVAASSDLITALPTADPVVALLDACVYDVGTATPVYGLLYEFLTQQPLAENLTEESCTRAAEFAVLSRQHRMLFRGADTYTAVPAFWTDAQGDELKVDVPADWQSPDEIDLYLHFFAAGIDSIMVEAMVNKANAIMQLNRAGVRFVSVHPDAHGSRQRGLCGFDFIVDTLGISLDDPRLNVAYVNGIGDNNSGATNGFMCPDSGRAGRMIYINWSLVGTQELLAHELGHALGHMKPHLGFDHPLAGSTPGFAKSNLMHEYDGVSREWLTIGQVFRMNVDVNSWYQHEPKVTPHPARACGCEPYTRDICPRLDRHPGVAPLPAVFNYCFKKP